MDAKPSTINQILYLPERYVIPVFQRFYEWDETHWKQLWADIQSVFDNRTEALSHFIGPFVFISHSSPSSTLHLIIDGQQRLITISFLFAALRDLAREKDMDSLADLLNNYLFFKDADGISQMRLITRVLDRETFKSILNFDFSVIDQTSKIFKAYDFFKSRIREFIVAAGLEYASALKELTETITRQLQLVEITLNPTDNPSNIYQSLNFKGKKLSDADLIRNYIFMKLPIDEQERYESAVWRKFEDQFSSNSQLNTELIEDYYYRFLILKKGYLANKTLYSEFTKFVDTAISDNHSERFDELEKFAILLNEFAEYYFYIVNLSEPDIDLRKALYRISRLSIDTATPFLLSLYYRFKNNNASDKINKAEFIALLQCLESFAIRRSFLRLRTRGYGLDFADAIKRSTTLDDLRKYFASKAWPTDQEIREALRAFPIYIHEKKKANLILSEVEHALGHKEEVVLEDLTIEHVLPQALTDEWRTMLGSDPDGVHERLVHTIGNLTLTGYNDDLGNLPYPEKKAILSESKLSINKHFENIDIWDGSQITARTELITKQVCRLWPRPKNL